MIECRACTADTCASWGTFSFCPPAHESVFDTRRLTGAVTVALAMRGFVLGAFALLGACTFDSGGLGESDLGADEGNNSEVSPGTGNDGEDSSSSSTEEGLTSGPIDPTTSDTVMNGSTTDAPPETESGGETGPPLPPPEGLPSFMEAVEIVELNSDRSDDDPTLSTDLLEIFFGSTREGGAENIFTSVRASPTDPWDVPVPVAELNTDAAETTPELSPDGRLMSFAREVGGQPDVFVTTRPQRDQPWLPPVSVMSLTSTSDDSGFVTTGGERNAFFCSARRGSEDLFFAERLDMGSDVFEFEQPLLIGALSGTGTRECTPWVERNGQLIVFATNIGKSMDSEDDDLYWTELPPGETAIEEIGFVNTTEREEDPWLADNLGVIYFARGIGDSQDIFAAERQP